MKLTDQQIRQAVEAFTAVTIRHPLQESTLEKVLFLLLDSPNVNIVNLVGPTGIGKSELQMRVIACVQDEYAKEMQADHDCVPIIRSLAMAAGHRQFDWKSLYRSGLHGLGDPFAMTRKAVPGRQVAKPAQFLYAGESRTASELRLHLEDEFRKRKSVAWIIDEAQHMVFGGRSGVAGDQFDVLKSIGQRSQVKILLAGPPEMGAGLGSSPQLARRSATVHYPRYHHANADHMETFGSVVATLFSHMDLAGHPAVSSILKLIYSGSAGCVGIVKDWLAKAYGLALRDQQDGQRALLTVAHLQSTRLSLGSMRAIMNDIRLEEESARDGGSDADYERIVTGYADPQASDSQSPAKPPKPKSGAARVGIRSTGPRDKVPTEAQKQEEAYA